jgi:hypothetical protein
MPNRLPVSVAGVCTYSAADGRCRCWAHRSALHGAARSAQARARRRPLRWAVSAGADATSTRPALRHLAHRQHRLGARADAQRAQHRGDVVLHGFHRQVELARDELVGQALQQQRQHLGLARREADVFDATAASGAARPARPGPAARRPGCASRRARCRRRCGCARTPGPAWRAARTSNPSSPCAGLRAVRRATTSWARSPSRRCRWRGSRRWRGRWPTPRPPARPGRRRGTRPARRSRRRRPAPGRAAPGRSRLSAASVARAAAALSTPTTVVSLPMLWITACRAARTRGWSSTSSTFMGSPRLVWRGIVWQGRTAAGTHLWGVARQVSAGHRLGHAGRLGEPSSSRWPR